MTMKYKCRGQALTIPKQKSSFFNIAAFIAIFLSGCQSSNTNTLSPKESKTNIKKDSTIEEKSLGQKSDTNNHTKEILFFKESSGPYDNQNASYELTFEGDTVQIIYRFADNPPILELGRYNNGKIIMPDCSDCFVLKENELCVVDVGKGKHCFPFVRSKSSNSIQNVVGPLSTRSSSLDNRFIWSILYPGNNKFDKKGQLIDSFIEEESLTETKTRIGKVFYFNNGGELRATVILFTHFFESDGQEKTCHGCPTQVGVATFQKANNQWKKIKFIKDWNVPQEGYGVEPKFQLKTFKNMTCLYLKFDSDEVFEYYFNASNLKEIK